MDAKRRSPILWFAVALLSLFAFPHAVASISRGASGSEPGLVRDIETQNRHAGLGSFTEFSGALYFVADTRETWRAAIHETLWRSDGTAGGTEQVWELFASTDQAQYINVHSLVVFKNELYFVVTTPDAANTVWKSDGTAEGTQQVTQAKSKYLAGATTDFLFFWEDTETGSSELKAWDGMSDTPTTVHQAEYYSPDSHPSRRSVAQNGIFYYLIAGNGLWRSDGTISGTYQIISGDVMSLTVDGERVFFFKDEDVWSTDGTVAGTSLALTHATYPDVYGGEIALGAEWIYANNGRWWVGNYTEPSATEIGGRHNGDWGNGIILNNMLLFQVGDYDPNPGNLMRVTGTGSAQSVKQIAAASPDIFFLDATDEYAYFVADDGIHGHELWRTDGTSNGTVMVRDIAVGATSSTASPLQGISSSYENWLLIGNILYFSAYDPQGNVELWRSDGTETGTVRLTDIGANVTEGSYPSMLTAGTNYLFFVTHLVSGIEVWRTDGTEAGTVMALDDLDDPASGFYYTDPVVDMGPVAGKMIVSLHRYFQDEFDAFRTANELWAIAEASGMQEMLYRFPDTEAENSLRVGQFGLLGDKLFFAANTDWFADVPLPHAGIWVTDGTGAGTSRLHPHNNIQHLTVFNDSLVYADNGLWISDGSADGEQKLTDIIAGLPGYDRDEESFSVLGSHLYFIGTTIAEDYSTNYALWVTDGTAGGTNAVGQLPLGLQYPTDNMVAGLSKLYFVWGSPDFGTELWISDGSTAGTYMLKDIVPGMEGSQPELLAVDGDVAYFAADDGVHGRELWRTDGTPIGTEMVADIVPGNEGSWPQAAALNADGLYFHIATSETNPNPYESDLERYELWRLDLTTYNVERIVTFGTNDWAAGCSSYWHQPETMRFDDNVYFSGCDVEKGVELWMISAADMNPPTPTPKGTATPTTTSSPIPTLTPTATLSPTAVPTSTPEIPSTEREHVYLPHMRK